jgi:hypothetical protein
MRDDSAPGPVCPRCDGYVIVGSDLHGGVDISRGPYAGRTRHRTCITPTAAEQLAAAPAGGRPEYGGKRQRKAASDADGAPGHSSTMRCPSALILSSSVGWV